MFFYAQTFLRLSFEGTFCFVDCLISQQFLRSSSTKVLERSRMAEERGFGALRPVRPSGSPGLRVGHSLAGARHIFANNARFSSLRSALAHFESSPAPEEIQSRDTGGGERIRTPESRETLTVFKTAAFGHLGHSSAYNYYSIKSCLKSLIYMVLLSR